MDKLHSCEVRYFYKFSYYAFSVSWGTSCRWASWMCRKRRGDCRRRGKLMQRGERRTAQVTVWGRERGEESWWNIIKSGSDEEAAREREIFHSSRNLVHLLIMRFSFHREVTFLAIKWVAWAISDGDEWSARRASAGRWERRQRSRAGWWCREKHQMYRVSVCIKCRWMTQSCLSAVTRVASDDFICYK